MHLLVSIGSGLLVGGLLGGLIVIQNLPLRLS
jgi:hypothetical protein